MVRTNCSPSRQSLHANQFNGRLMNLGGNISCRRPSSVAPLSSAAQKLNNSSPGPQSEDFRVRDNKDIRNLLAVCDSEWVHIDKV